MTTSDRSDENVSRTEIPPGERAGSRMFEDVNTCSILRQVPTKLGDEVTRSLWRRLNSEFMSGGSKGLTTYLRARFGDIDAEIRDELAAAMDAG